MGVLSRSILGIREHDSQTPHAGVSSWVARSIAIGIVLFIMFFVALHLYCNCKPGARSEAPPMFEEPPRLYDAPPLVPATLTETSPTKTFHKWIPLRRTVSSSSLRVPLIPSDSNRTQTQIPLTRISLPAKAHFKKSKLTAPTAGNRPSTLSLSIA